MAVTGQHDLTNDFDILPAFRECSEVLAALEDLASRPNVVPLQSTPEGDGQDFRAGDWGDDCSRGFILDGNNLNGKIPNGKRTYIHQPVLSAGGFRLVVKG